MLIQVKPADGAYSRGGRGESSFAPSRISFAIAWRRAAVLVIDLRSMADLIRHILELRCDSLVKGTVGDFWTTEGHVSILDDSLTSNIGHSEMPRLDMYQS
jgi:hypothetical protein